MVGEKGSTWPLRVLRCCCPLLRSLGSPTTESLTAGLLRDLDPSGAGGELTHDPMPSGSLVPAALWGLCLQPCTVLERPSVEAACSAPKEESPSPHRQRAPARNETPGPGSVQKSIPEVEKDDMELALRWLRGDLSVLTCFPFFVKRGKSAFLMKF